MYNKMQKSNKNKYILMKLNIFYLPARFFPDASVYSPYNAVPRDRTS